MHNMLTVNSVNAYNFWWMASPEGKNVEALFKMTNTNTDFSVMKQGYAFGQFSKFVRPGYLRVDVDNPFPARDPAVALTTTELTTMQICFAAFKSPRSDRAVLVAINDSANPRTLQVNFGPAGSSPRTLDVWRTSSTENLAAAGSVTVTSGTAVLSLPAYSVSTFTGAIHAESFSSWCALHELPVDGTGTGAPDAQPAGDGIENLVKYGFGLDPFTKGLQGRFEEKVWINTAGAGNPRFFSMEVTLPEPAPGGINYRALGTDDLAGWPDTLIEASRVSQGGGLQKVIWRDTVPMTNAPKRFLKLGIEQSP
jgi:hypothetical protein